MQTRLEPRRRPAAPGEAALRLDGVTRRFARRGAPPLQALQEISFELAHGEVLALVGPSGCGKTTLLELVCGLQQPDEGTVRAEPAALMPQQDLLLPWLSALDNAALALRVQGVARQEARRTAGRSLAALGLEGFERARPSELSGGMRQRVAFVRTLLSGKPVLCLDEPFGALDAITRAAMQDWLESALQREPRTVLFVTHDVEEAIVLADRVLVLSGRPGRVRAEFPVTAPRPRERTQPQLVALRAQALRALASG